MVSLSCREQMLVLVLAVSKMAGRDRRKPIERVATGECTGDDSMQFSDAQTTSFTAQLVPIALHVDSRDMSLLTYLLSYKAVATGAICKASLGPGKAASGHSAKILCIALPNNRLPLDSKHCTYCTGRGVCALLCACCTVLHAYRVLCSNTLDPNCQATAK